MSIIFSCIFLASCSFEPRSSKAMPDELSKIYFSPVKPDSVLTTQLNELFRSLHVRLVKQQSAAPFSVIISRDHFSYSRPDFVDATLPTVISFSQFATISIENNKNHKTVVKKEFITGLSVTLNANQIYTADANNLMRRQLCQQLITLIYYWFIASNTQAALYYANHPKTAHHTS